MKIKTRKKLSAGQGEGGLKKASPKIEFIGTGCTAFDLALSGKGRRGGFARGRIANIVGDGSTGKTLLALETAAWCYHNLKKVRSKIFPPVKNMSIVYNNVEGVMDFPLETMFGRGFSRSIEWIRISTAEAIGRDLQRRVKAMKKGDFFLYICDSWDGVKPEEEVDRFEKEAKTDKKISDGYGLSKQQYVGEFFRNITDTIYGNEYSTTYDYQTNQKDVTLLFNSQIRQKINATKFEKQVYRVGGKAFDFWTHQVAWLYRAGKIQPEKKGKKVTIGVKVRAVIERNKCAPPWKEANFPILFDYGIDDIGSMVDFVCGPQSKGFSFKGISSNVKEKFITALEDKNLADEFRSHYIETWHKIEDSAKVVRRPKYEDNS